MLVKSCRNVIFKVLNNKAIIKRRKMCTILLSINPNYVEKILNGTKIYEFRKRVCKRNVDKILIYATNPIMKIVGEAEVEDVLIDVPEIIWKKTEGKSGIDKVFFNRYYKDRELAVAYKLKNVKRYRTPKELKEYGIRRAPQSFQYIEEI